MTKQNVIRRATRLPLNHPGYAPPTHFDVRKAKERSGMTGADLGAALGVDKRTIRRWAMDPREPHARTIPPAAWRLLLLVAGLALDSAGVALQCSTERADPVG